MPFVALSERTGEELPAGAFDLRGWSVRTLVDRRKVGTVRDLLLDSAKRPRYVEIGLERAGRHILLPIGHARSDRQRRVIWVPGLTNEALEALPPYGRNPTELTRDYETDLIAAYRRALTGESHSSPRAVHGGSVYGPTELETDVVIDEPVALKPMSRLSDFRIAEGDPDPRGWELLGGDGAVLGVVEELLVDTGTWKVRHLVCRLHEEMPGLERLERRVLIPAGFVRLDEARGLVLVDVLAADSVGDLPLYSGEDVGREVEQELLERVEARSGERFYQHPRFDYRACFDEEAR